MSGILSIVATPIGHLEDITTRALATLRAADLIACEDTRHSRRLLDAYGIDRSLLPLHQHNESAMTATLIRRLQEGANIALISDAGTPLVSDPGATLTAAAHRAGIRVVPIAGASSVITALSASGLPADQFYFAGFLPAKLAAKEKRLEAFQQADCTTIFFETPHRIAETLNCFIHLFSPERELTLARELTKQFEQIKLLKIKDLAKWMAADPNHLRGEFVLLLAPATNTETSAESWQELAQDLQRAGVSSKDAAAIIHKHTGANKKTVYSYFLSLKT